MNYLSFLVSASAKAFTLKTDFDVIFVYQLSPITMAVPGMILKRLSGKPVYMYTCDLWPESMKNLITNERNAAFQVMRRLSRKLYTESDAIAVNSKPFVDYLVTEHNIPAHKISYLPHHAEDTGVHVSTKKTDATEFAFMGNVGLAQDIDCILDAAVIMRDTHPFRVHIVGDGSYFKTAEALVAEKGLEDHVLLHGRHPAECMAEFYRMADACLLTLRAGSWIGLTMPSKLQGYMSAGKPVIAAIDGAAKEVIEDSGCGVCVGAGDSVALAAAMTDFVENRSAYEHCGMNGRAYYEEHFTKRRFMLQLEGALVSLVEPLPEVHAGELVPHPTMVARPLRVPLDACEEPVA